MRLKIPKPGVPFQVQVLGCPTLYCRPGAVVNLSNEQAKAFEKQYPVIFASCQQVSEPKKNKGRVNEKNQENYDDRSVESDVEPWAVLDSGGILIGPE